MYKIYKIQDEKTLSEIANKFDISLEQLKAINGINGTYIIEKGNFIIVPKDERNNDNFITYKVKPGDTIYRIAENFGIPYKQLLDLNGLDKDEYIYIDQEILVPNKDVTFRITGENETLNNIADELSTTAYDIIEQNNMLILEPNQLIVYKRR